MARTRRRYLVLGALVLAVLLGGVFTLGALLPSGGHSTSTAGTDGLAARVQMAPAGIPGKAVAAGGGRSATPLSASSGANSTFAGATAGEGTVGAAVSRTTATRIVRTGDITLSVAASAVGSTVDRLGAVATSLGGYVQSSDTERGVAPSGTVTLRVPVARFVEAVSQAEKLGHVDSASTTSRDVTGKFVDLVAREHSLRQTRATYLTILSHASTIGATLAVQNRVDDVQSQIEQLQGQISLLRHQSSDATLRVDVTASGAVAHRPHHDTGLTAAWHTTTHRFARGVEAIIGILGPLFLALLIAALLVAAAVFGRRAVRRFAR